MNKTLPTIALLLCLFNSNAQLNLKSNPVKSNDVREFIDPISKARWLKVDMRVWSYEKINHYNRKYCARIDFYSKSESNVSQIEMRFKLNTNINEWPLNKKAYVIVNEQISEIELTDVNSAFFQIDEEDSTTDMNGNTTSVVSTRDFQLFRKESNLTKALSDVEFINTFSLIVYSGEMPVEFRFDGDDMDKLQAILN